MGGGGFPIEVSLRKEGPGRPQRVTRSHIKECWNPCSWKGTRGSFWEVSKETAPCPFPLASRTGIEHISVAFQTLTVWPTECAHESLHTAVPPNICLESSQTDRCVRAAAPGSKPAQSPRDKMLHWRPGVPRVNCHLSDKSQVSQKPAPL